MKLIFRMLFFICLLPSFAYGYTETHYVTQDGAGSKTGRSLFNAWAVSQFNNSSNWSANVAVDGKIGPNDVVYFSGTITTRLDLKGSGTAGNPITLDGYEAGDCNPIANGSCPGATVPSGLSPTQGFNYVTFQDFNITTTLWSFWSYSYNHLKFLRNNWDSANSAHIAMSGTMSYLWFEGNRFGNYALNYNAAQGVNFYGVHHIVLRGNYFTGHNGIANSSNKIEFHQCTNILYEYNWADSLTKQGNGSAVVFKEDGNQNAIVRFNKFVTIRRGALDISFPTTTSFFVYGNYFYRDPSNYTEHAIPLEVYDAATNVNIWSNVIMNYSTAGIVMWWRTLTAYGYPDTVRIKNIKIYNNTIHNNAMNGVQALDQTGLSINDSGATGIIVKNNIFSNNRPTTSDRRQINNQIGSNLTLEHNTYFHSGGAPVVYHFGGDRTIPTLQSSYQREDDSPAGVVANPGLNTDGTLNGTYINNGANLSGLAGSLTIHGTTYNMYWQTALHPSTDWSGQPSESKIITADQNGYAAWQRGAYVYDKDIPIKPPLGVTVTPY